jgi:hypothetical protein
MATYCFDLDGTLCLTVGSDYEGSQPQLDRISVVNALYNAGHRIVIHTARGGTSGRDWSVLTAHQLSIWGVLHHVLVLGKPAADYYIDDKAIKDFDFFKDPI